MSHDFLSPEWIEAAKGVRHKYAEQEAKVTTSIRLNGETAPIEAGKPMLPRVMSLESGGKHWTGKQRKKGKDGGLVHIHLMALERISPISQSLYYA
mgnify:CR=1 FL=1